MTVEKVNYICVSKDLLNEEEQDRQRLRTSLPGIMDRVSGAMDRNQGWLRMQYADNEALAFYYNKAVRGLFPDFANVNATRPLLPLRIDQLYPSGITLAGMKADLISRQDLQAAFPSRKALEPLAAYWNWTKGFLDQYFAVNPCGPGSEVYRFGERTSVRWGTAPAEKACFLRVVHLEDYVSNGSWRQDILFLLKKQLLPVLEDGEEADTVSFLTACARRIQSSGADSLTAIEQMLERAENAGELSGGLSAGTCVKLSQEQLQAVKDNLLSCDYDRAVLEHYDEGTLSPLHGHWDLWEYVPYSGADRLPPPPARKIWADISGAGFYARDASADLAPTSETVAIDFGTKSTTVAYVDKAGCIMTIPVGRCSSNGKKSDKDYENPTILKYINFDSFVDAYTRAEGRPETSSNDISASYTAENGFPPDEMRDILAYQYQIKQWAYDSQLEPLIFDKHRQIKIKPYQEITETDFDPIEIYAYQVGLNIVNMHTKSICIRYLLSYPPSYGEELCKKIEESFKRGIQKAIPVQAQRTEIFQNNFSVIRWQSEPAAYAVCAIKEYAIEKKYKDRDVLCGVYDLGGGTVDYHFGIFKGGTPPYTYTSLENGGNPRLGCENILEQLAYDIFSHIKEGLLGKGIKYEVPHQNARDFQDMRYTSNSGAAKLNSLNLVNALREVWIRYFLPAEKGSGKLCYFQLYPESGNKKYFVDMVEATEKNKAWSLSVIRKDALPDLKEESVTLQIFVSPDYLRNFFEVRLDQTIKEFLVMLRQAIKKLPEGGKCVIFLAGNGSKSHLVAEIFESYEELQLFDCELYPPLLAKGAEEKGQKIQKTKGSVPNAKTGVAHGLLISRPGSDFVRIQEPERKFVFKYHLGESQYNQEQEESVFCLRKSADSFEQRIPREDLVQEDCQNPFDILEDGYLQFWYTDAAVVDQSMTLAECSAQQFLIRVPDALLSKALYGGKRGECYCRAVTQTSLELLIARADSREYESYGILDLRSGQFQAWPQESNQVG